MRRSALTVLLGIGSASCAHGGPPPPVRPTAAELSQWIDAYVAAADHDRPPAERMSGFVGVAKAGQWVHQRGYRVDPTDAVPGPDTRFRIGSISKQFGAMVILKLAEQGRLRMTDPVGAHVDGLGAAVAAVPMEHLLSHSSGIVDFTEDEALMSTWMQPHSLDDLLRTVRYAPLRFVPGTRFEYCNTNYLLLALVADRLAGGFEAYLQAHVLGPAGMRRSGTVDAPDLPDTARGHTAGAHGERVAAPVSDMILGFPGMLRATGNDLRAWDRAYARHAVLSVRAQDDMLSPRMSQLPAEVRDAVPTLLGYGYGVNVLCDHGHEIQGHGGRMAGFDAFFARIPADHWAVVILTDSDQIESRALGKAILQMLLTGAPVLPGGESQGEPCADPATRAR
ncbi:MAG: serine hydrolase domain-containing protein [Polyangiales bacterium]